MTYARIEELSFDEILAIQIDSPEWYKIIDLECAHAGVPLLPDHPGDKPKGLTYEEDITLHTVGNWGFTDPTVAQQIVDLITQNKPCTTNTKSRKEVVTPIPKGSYKWPSISIDTGYSQELFDSFEGEALKVADQISAWKEKKDTYDEALQERQDVIKTFSAQRSYASHVTEGVSQMQRTFNRYMELSQGIYEVATDFMVDACKNASMSKEDHDLYFMCNRGDKHLAISKETWQQESVERLLGATDDE